MLEDLRIISQEYLSVKEDCINAMMFCNVPQNQKSKEEKWGIYKSLEREKEKKIEQFKLKAQVLTEDNNLTLRGLILQIIDEIINDTNSPLDIYLLIHLMWNDKETVDQRYLQKIEELIFQLTRPKLINGEIDYYLESLVDIWNYGSDEPIPIHVLENVLLIEHKGEYKFGSFVKAISYLNAHNIEQVKLIHDKIKLTKKYKNEEYYRDWME